ncbi:hypothetical protein [Cyclobacterium amurskyense]|uniref:hypothetical protein n=1 Tax=Cyclobacterium amurskyense TaxID=320787 RepID=UPI00065DCD42|nr:hypothetical protein [Cyclobacterium amurskyense]
MIDTYCCIEFFFAFVKTNPSPPAPAGISKEKRSWTNFTYLPVIYQGFISSYGFLCLDKNRCWKVSKQANYSIVIVFDFYPLFLDFLKDKG